MPLDYSLFELSNGLRVVHHRDEDSSMVALNILYNVGARDDDNELTGMAHLFEHLMFGGSVNIPDFDGTLELAGGSNNAWTSDDFTCYWDLLPAQNVESGFRLESDRMLSLAFSPQSLEVQRHVVIEEFKQVCLNRPYGDISHHLRKMLFQSHPYRYPAIGKEPDHIERVTMDDVRHFFHSHYAPNNAVLAVVGNITLEDTKALAEKWFGPIPRRQIAPRSGIVEPEPAEAMRLKVEVDVPQTMLIIAFPMGGYAHEHYIGADLLTDILAGGRSSRFYRRLMMGTDLFTEVDASIAGLEECGYLMVNACLRSHNLVEEAEKAIWEELNKILTEKPEAHEVQRVLNVYETNRALSELNTVHKAQNLAQAVMHDEDPAERLGQYLATTADDIHAAARAIISPTRSRTLIYGPAATE